MKTVSGRHSLFCLAIFLAIAVLTVTASMALAGWQNFDPNNTGGKLPSYQITGLALRSDSLWVGTDSGLVEFDTLTYDPNDGSAGWTMHPDADPNGTGIQAMDSDTDGIIWIGTQQGLISYDPNISNPANRISVYNIDPNQAEGYDPEQALQVYDIEADPNFVWMATDSGLFRFDKEDKWDLYRNDPNGFTPTSARAVSVSPDDDNVWVLPSIFSFVIYKYSIANKKWELIEPDQGNPIFNSIVAGVNNNDVWLGSVGSGLWRYQTGTGWTQWKYPDDALPSNTIQALGLDENENKIIVVTDSGIARYDAVLDLWQPVGTVGSSGLGSSHIATDILTDPNVMDSASGKWYGQVWFATESGGLYRWLQDAIIWSSPENGSQDVALDIGKIEVVFNCPIDQTTVEFDRIGETAPLAIGKTSDPNWPADPNDFTISWQDPNHTHLILTPASALDPNTLYTFIFTKGILDSSGEPIINNYYLEFETALPSAMPQVVSSDPANDANDVLPDTQVRIWFNKLMDQSSFLYKVWVIDPSIGQYYLQAGEMAFVDTNITLLTISAEFEPGKTYTITVSKDVKDLSGTTMLANFSLAFMTKSAPQIVYSPVSPYSPWPQDNATNVSIDTNIAVTFDRSMDPNSVEESFIIDPDIKDLGAFIWNSPQYTRVVFQPYFPLGFETTYSMTISASASDEDGIPLGQDMTWFFTTESIPEIVFNGNTYPVGDSNVPVDTDIKVEFSQPMDPNSVRDAFYLSRNQDFSDSLIVNYNWVSGDKIFNFYPIQVMEYGTKYYVKIDETATGKNGIALQERTWSFTTVPQPHIVSVFPGNGESSIPVYTRIVVIFDQPMDKASVEGAFSLADANATEDITGSFLWNDNDDPTGFQFEADSPLSNGHTFTVTISASAESKDGITLEEDEIRQFTTVQKTDEPPQEALPDVVLPNATYSLSDPNTPLVITAMAFDGNERLWAGMALNTTDPWTGLGLFHFNGQGWTRYTTNDGLTSDFINDLEFDSQGNLWIATEPDPNGLGGVAMLNGQGLHDYPPAYDPNSIQGIQGFFTVNEIGVYSTGSRELICIATDAGLGMGMYDSGYADWRWSGQPAPWKVGTLSVNSSTGNMWFPSVDFWAFDVEPCDVIAGISVETIANNISQDPYLWPDIWSDPNIWMWPDAGVFRSLQKIRYQLPNTIRLWAIAEDPNNLWLATNEGLYRIDIKGFKSGECRFERYDQFTTKGGLLSGLIYDIKVDDSTDPCKLYVATDKGICIYTIGTDIENFANWTQLPFASSSGDRVSFEFIPGKALYINSGNGLLVVGSIEEEEEVQTGILDFIGDGCFINSLER
ncbi:Ig-like domain-containing protein [bacterium]|nr:Ig-like domain-containing protein [bacterium]